MSSFLSNATITIDNWLSYRPSGARLPTSEFLLLKLLLLTYHRPHSRPHSRPTLSEYLPFVREHYYISIHPPSRTRVRLWAPGKINSRSTPNKQAMKIITQQIQNHVIK